MPITTTCPHCSESESFPDTEAGKSVNCPACGGAIELPRSAPVVAQAKPIAAAVVAQAKPIAAAVVAQAKPMAAAPVAAAPVAKAPVVLKAKSKPAVDLDDEDDRPRKKSKPAVELDDEEERPRKKSKPAVDLDEDEEKPRKKSKPIVDLEADDAPAPKSKSQPEFAFDDEPDPAAAPKTKKRPRDEDEDDDDRPRRKPAKKKGGGGKLLIILGGIAFVLFAGCAGGGYYFYLETKKTVASMQSQFTFPTEPESSKPTKSTEVKPGPNLKANARLVNNGDTYDTVVSTKMGLGLDCRVEDLAEMLKNFKDPNGADKALFGAILDWYAPWVDKGCAKIYMDAGAKARVLVVFADPKFNRPKENSVKAVLVVDAPTPNRSAYEEMLRLPRSGDGDQDYVRLGLKEWIGLKEKGAGTDPPKPADIVKITALDLAAEVYKDRAAAVKKYEGATLEITGEVNSKSATGAVLILKGGTDENTMKALIVPVSMKLDQREAAKKYNAGDTVTVTGTLAMPPMNSPIIPIRDGVLKK